MSKMMLGALATLTFALATGCASAEKKPDDATTQAAQKDADAKKRSAARLTAAEKDGASDAPKSGPVYFHFDSSELLPEGQRALSSVATYLKQNPDASIVLEGHCDARGTEEYNLSLGQRRAEVMKAYLERLGVKPKQVRTVSYGKLKPVVNGDGEDAWAQNRRGEVKLEGMGRAG